MINLAAGTFLLSKADLLPAKKQTWLVHGGSPGVVPRLLNFPQPDVHPTVTSNGYRADNQTTSHTLSGFRTSARSCTFRNSGRQLSKSEQVYEKDKS